MHTKEILSVIIILISDAYGQGKVRYLLKQIKGLSSFNLERYSCINKKFLLFWFFQFAVLAKILEKMSKMKLLSAF